jgi:hypothetical protein
MTIYSITMLAHCTGDDFNPMRIWRGAEDKVIRMKHRAVDHYENIRLVYQLECRLKDLQAQQDAYGRQQRLN